MAERPSIYYSKEFYKKRFCAATMKKAYMDACKWYATRVMHNDELHSVQVEFEKLDGQQLPTVVIHMYAVLNEEELRARHCAICREHHTAFYMNSTAPCNKCEANAYQRRTDDMLSVKLEYYRSLIHKATRGEEQDDASTESTG